MVFGGEDGIHRTMIQVASKLIGEFDYFALSGFCAENGTTKRSLAANLEELRDSGTITDQLFEWATALRLSGNEAAHDVSVTFSEEDAKDLLDFTVAILDFTYSFRVKFEAFLARRKGGR